MEPLLGPSDVDAERAKGVVPARRAMSCSPSCQCIASAARHGMAISSAILAHISGLNLFLSVLVASAPLTWRNGYVVPSFHKRFYANLKHLSLDVSLTSRKVLLVYSSAPRPRHFVSRGSFGSAAGS